MAKIFFFDFGFISVELVRFQLVEVHVYVTLYFGEPSWPLLRWKCTSSVFFLIIFYKS